MRWFTALNIKDTDAYKSVNARLVYLHMLCSMDYKTRVYDVSARATAADVGITYKAARCAIDALLAAGLIRAQGGAQSRAQATAYVISDLPQSEGASEGATRGAPINNNNIKFTLTHARGEFLKPERVEKIMEYLVCDYDTAEWHAMRWLAMMAIRERTEWQDERDAWQHLLSWIDKRKKEKRPTEPPKDWSKNDLKAEEPKPSAVKVPEGWTEKDWLGLCHIVHSPNPAPECVRIYNEVIKSMSK